MRTAHTAVTSFFKLNLQPLLMLPQDRPHSEAEGSRILSKAEIWTILDHARSRKVRAEILFLKDAGIRCSDVVQLRWGDLRDLGESFYGFQLVTQKNRVPCTSFIGPETSDLLFKLKPSRENRYNITIDDDALIFGVQAKAVSNVITLICHDAGIDGVIAHGLRKYARVFAMF